MPTGDFYPRRSWRGNADVPMTRVVVVDDAGPQPSAWRAMLAAFRDIHIVGEAGDLTSARSLLQGADYEIALIRVPLGGAGWLGGLLPLIRPAARPVLLAEAPDDVVGAAEAARLACLVRPVEAVLFENALRAPRAPTGACVLVKAGSVTRILRADEIRLVAACENYTEVMLANGEHLFARRTMQEWAGLLPCGQFARAHRGLFVNLATVGRVERILTYGARLHFAGEVPPAVEVKRRHWPALRRRLAQWRLAFVNPGAPKIPPRSIAVLPWVNLSNAAANDRFCAGLTEELINVLGKMPGLQVAARSSVPAELSFREIGRQLGVSMVLRGSVRQDGHRVRITAQLVNAGDGFHLWSENFDRELNDVFDVQDSLAGLIAQALRSKLSPALPPPVRVNPEAHWLVLEGRHFWSLRTGEGLAHAEAAFARALKLDADFAPAHAGIADVHNIRALYRLADGETDAAADLERAERHARRAHELDSFLSEPLATLGFVAFHQGRLSEGRAMLERALALNPEYATGHQFLAWTLAAEGRMQRALEVYRRAVALDPLCFINVDRFSALLFLAGRHEEALATNLRAATLRPDVFVGNLAQRAPILLALGRTDEAVAVARAVRATQRERPFRRNSDSDAIYVLRAAGFVGEARAYARDYLTGLPAQNYVRGFVLAAAGDFDAALPMLASTPSIMLPQLYWSPIWEAGRGDARFAALIARLGREAEYVRARGSGAPRAERTTAADRPRGATT